MTAKTAPTNEVAELDWDRDLEGYEVQETDIGEKIDWKDEIGFKGVYKGTNVVEVLDEGSGEMTFVKIHQFKDEFWSQGAAAIIASQEARAGDYGGRIFWHDDLVDFPVLIGGYLNEVQSRL